MFSLPGGGAGSDGQSFCPKWCIISGTCGGIRLPDVHKSETPVRFYRTDTGREPVLEWLRSLDREDRRAIGLDLMRVQLGWPVGMPLVRSLQQGLWELRSQLPSRRIARLMLCFHQNEIIVLHAFIKKTRSTPPDDLAWARRRMKEVTA